MTRIAKHSNQKCDINTRNIHKEYFLVIFGGLLVYVTLLDGYIFCSLQPWVGYFFPLP